jgi:hypothetical protein
MSASRTSHRGALAWTTLPMHAARILNVEDDAGLADAVALEHHVADPQPAPGIGHPRAPQEGSHPRVQLVLAVGAVSATETPEAGGE